MNDFRIGVNRAQNLSWEGDYANIKVYNKALGTNELISLLNEGPGTAPPEPAIVTEIQIAFHPSSTTLNAMDPSTTPTNQGVVVNTLHGYWNNLNNGGNGANAFGPMALLGSSTNNSGATLSGSNGFAAANGINWSAENKDWVMMEGWYGFKETEYLTVSNLPASFTSEYHVVVYGDANGSRTMPYTLDGVTKSINDVADFAGVFEEGDTYVIYSGLTNATFTLTGNSSGSRSAINGLLIKAGPPPATILSFEADDEYVTPGSNVVLSWSAGNYDTLTLNPGGINADALSIDGVGSNTVLVNATTEYTLTAVKGSVTNVETLIVGAGPPRPNLIIFLVDDMGVHDTSVEFILDGNGDPVTYAFNNFYHTPNMETLAETGMRPATRTACRRRLHRPPTPTPHLKLSKCPLPLQAVHTAPPRLPPPVDPIHPPSKLLARPPADTLPLRPRPVPPQRPPRPAIPTPPRKPRPFRPAVGTARPHPH